MNQVLSFAQDGLTAAACFFCTLMVLWGALEVYGKAFNTFVKLIGIHGVFCQFIWEKRKQNKFWVRFGMWYERAFIGKDDY